MCLIRYGGQKPGGIIDSENRQAGGEYQSIFSDFAKVISCTLMILEVLFLIKHIYFHCWE